MTWKMLAKMMHIGACVLTAGVE